MRKIRNPFPEQHPDKDFNCFGCSPFNDHGLKLEFREENGELFSVWLPTNDFEGYPGIVHGGILAALIDETCSWLVYALLQTAGVTAELCIKYHKPVRIAGGEIKIIARMVTQDKNAAMIRCEITGCNNICHATAEATFFLFPEKIARLKYKYPGPDAFTS